MNAIRYKLATGMLASALVVVTIYTWTLVANHKNDRLEATAALNMMMEYKRMRKELGQMTTPDIVEYWIGIDHRESRKSSFNNNSIYQIVQNETEQMKDAIVSELCKKTGDNLGYDEAAWMKKYGYGSTNLAPTHQP